MRFFEAVYRDNAKRVQDRRALAADALLYARNRALQPLERALTLWAATRSHHPLLFIVGLPRSGTTVTHQLLARHLRVGFISNFVARSWMAPLVGTYRYFARFGRGPHEVPLTSHLGRSEGPHGPHEFGWFWQFHMDGPPDELDDESAARVDWSAIQRELVGLTTVWNAPVVLKNLNHVDCNISYFARHLPDARFLYVRRDARFVAQSILESRLKRYGNEETWWSVRPRGAEAWGSLSALEQVARQVRAVRARIEGALSAPTAPPHLNVDYATLAADPASTLQRIAEFAGTKLQDAAALATAKLDERDRVRLPADRFDELARLLEGGP